jgi:transcriptional/translational regulatory protein YebC/TACO1
MFERKGQLLIETAGAPDEDAMLEAALEAGAEDLKREGDQYVVTTEPTEFHAVKTALEARGITPSESEITMLPKTTVRVEGKTAESLLKLLEELEELEDVQKVSANFDMDVAEMAQA